VPPKLPAIFPEPLIVRLMACPARKALLPSGQSAAVKLGLSPQGPEAPQAAMRSPILAPARAILKRRRFWFTLFPLENLECDFPTGEEPS
jgi:hypothetical protein